MAVSAGAGHLPRQRGNVRMRPHGRGALLSGPHSDRVHRLNETALAIWELCDGTTAVHEMVEGVCLLFDIDRDTATRDVERILAELTGASLVTWAPRSSTETP